jgi:hypothetical protein
MTVYLDKKFINLLSPQLDKFGWQRATLANCRCPLCGDSKKNPNKKRGFFYERSGRYYYKCHNCGAAMSLSRLLEQVSPALHSEFRVEWLKEKNGNSNVSGITSTGVNEKLQKVSMKSEALTGVCKITSLDKCHHARAYLESRMLPQEKMDELFYTDDFGSVAKQINKKIHLEKEPRIVIPFHDESGNIIGVQGRSLSKNGLRYITIKADGHERLFYNLHKVDVNKTIYVTEGPFDSMFLPNAIAMVGASKSVRLPENLSNSNVVFVMDNEPRSVEIVNMLRGLIDDGQTVFIPDRLEHKDINEMILSGNTSDNIVEYIDDHSYTGILAQAAMSQWERTTERWSI